MGPRGRRKKPRGIGEGFPKMVMCELCLGGYLVFESWLGAEATVF